MTSFDILTSTANGIVVNLDVVSNPAAVACNRDLSLVAVGGVISSSFDGSSACHYAIEEIRFANVPPLNCDDGAVATTLRLANLSIANAGNGMEISVPVQGGAMTGSQSIAITADASGTGPEGAFGPMAINGFGGTLPEGTVGYGMTDTTVSFADTSTMLTTATPTVSGADLTVVVTGVTGSLTFSF